MIRISTQLVSWKSVLLVGWVVGISSSQAHSQQFKPDPVEAIREALKDIPPSPVLTDNPMARMVRKQILEHRREKLIGLVNKLRDLGEMRNALLLQGWRNDATAPDESAVDQAALDVLLKNFQQRLKADLDPKAPEEKSVAALRLVGKLASDNRRLNKTRSVHVIAMTQSLLKPLIEVAKSTSSQPLRLEAIRALGRLEAEAKTVTDALDFLLAKDVPLIYQKATLQAYLGMITDARALSKSTGTALLFGEKAMKTSQAILPGLLRGLQRNRQVELRRLASQGLVEVTESIDLVRPNLSKGYPPKGRPLTARETADIKSDKARLEQELEDLKPMRLALANRVDALAEALTDPDETVRVNSIRALENIAKLRRRVGDSWERLPTLPAPKGNGGAEEQEQPGDLDKKVPLGGDVLKATIPALQEAIKARHRTRERLDALHSLELLGPLARPSVASVVEQLDDPNPFIRWAAARALQKMSDSKSPSATVVQGLSKMITDPDIDARFAATRALRSFDPTPAVTKLTVPVLAREVANPQRDVKARLDYLETLDEAGLGAKLAIPSIAKVLSPSNASDPDLRIRAAQLLGRFGTVAKEAVPALRAAMKDDNEEVRTAVEEALLAVLTTK